MDNIVIFSSPIMCIVMGVIIAFHVIGTLVSEIGFRKPAVRVAVWVIAVLNAAAHMAVLLHAFRNKAEAAEMLLFLMISSAVAMTAIGLREKVSRGKKK